MARSYLSYYKPSNKAWIAACILFLSIVAIVYAVASSDISVSVKGAYDIQVNTGHGSQPIIIHQHIRSKPYGM